METTGKSYRVKREGLELWVPQYTSPDQERVWWNDYWENGQRVGYPTKEQAQTYLDTKKFIDQLPFQQYRKVTPSRLRQLTLADHHQRGGIIETREGPATFKIGDYLGQDSQGEFRVRRVKVERDFRQLTPADADGWADYQPIDVRLAAQLPHPCDLSNGQHGGIGDYIVQGSDSQWIVARDLFEAAYQPV